MLKSIVTLPITPQVNPSLGLVASILVGDFAARNLGLKFVLALGPQMRLSPPDRERTVTAFLDTLRRFGIRPDYVWRADTEDNYRCIQKLILRLSTEKKMIRKSWARIHVCSCGVVEKLSEATELYDKRRLYTIEQHGIRCKFCLEIAKQIERQVYRFTPSMDTISICPYPGYYSAEIQKQMESFLRISSMISRSRESSLHVEIDGEQVSLDNDFAWQLYLLTLPELGFEPELILGSNHSLRSIVTIATLQQALAPNSILQVLIPPYFLGEGRKRLGNADAIAGAYLKNSFRVIVASSLNWKKKESVIQIGQLQLLDKMFNRIQAAKLFALPALATVHDFMDRCEYRKIRKVVGGVRGDRGVSDVTPLFGVID